MKARISFVIAVGLFVFGAFRYAAWQKSAEPVRVFPASVNRDCAPWDGSAFTISVPLEEAAISISIYQSPDLARPGRFSFSDRTGKEGSALLILPIDAPEELTGSVSFQQVQYGEPVEGEFDLRSETMGRLKGKFVAEWGNEMIICG